MIKSVKFEIILFSLMITTGVAADQIVQQVKPICWSIETDFIQQKWPRERSREMEVGADSVRWRERVSKKEGIFAGVSFKVDLEKEKVWPLMSEYNDIGEMTPGVISVTFLQNEEQRQVVQVDMKVLWRTIQLRFEVERNKPNEIRFRMLNKALGEYRGYCTLQEQGNGRTLIDLGTWFNPARSVPMRLLLVVERITLLKSVKGFIASCRVS